MLVFPNAKINLGLNIISKRPDNYHNIETVFYPIGLKDALEAVPGNNPEGYSLHISGIQIDGATEKNLIVKAWKLLRDRFDLPGIDIFLHKIIPFGAGLGGGSADAAFMLKLAWQLFDLPVTEEELSAIAGTLGADCAFFLHNRPVLARGIGNEFENIGLSLKGYHLILIKPDIAVSTAEAYSLVKPTIPERSLKEIVERPVSEWKKYMINDFEKSVFSRYPAIKIIKEQLYERGALYASMSGSGSSVFGIFEKPEEELSKAFPHCFVWQEEL